MMSRFPCVCYRDELKGIIIVFSSGLNLGIFIGEMPLDT